MRGRGPLLMRAEDFDVRCCFRELSRNGGKAAAGAMGVGSAGFAGCSHEKAPESLRFQGLKLVAGVGFEPTTFRL
jgi:hypothetical protein